LFTFVDVALDLQLFADCYFAAVDGYSTILFGVLFSSFV